MIRALPGSHVHTPQPSLGFHNYYSKNSAFRAGGRGLVWRLPPCVLLPAFQYELSKLSRVYVLLKYHHFPLQGADLRGSCS